MVCVDLIDPYFLESKVRLADRSIKECKIILQGITYIDLATGWFEIAETPGTNKSSARISRLLTKFGCQGIFIRLWYCTIMGQNPIWRPLVKGFYVKAAYISIKNAHANAILVWIDQVIGSMLKNKDLVNIKVNELNLWDSILASVSSAIRFNCQNLNRTPGQLVFWRDMLPYWIWSSCLTMRNCGLRNRSILNYENIWENSKSVSHYNKVHGMSTTCEMVNNIIMKKTSKAYT